MEEKYIKWVSILILICGVLILVANYAKDYFTREKGKKEKELEQRKNATQGEIIASENNSTTPYEEMIELKIGGMSCRFKKTQFTKGVETPSCLSVEGCEPVIIKWQNNKLLVSTKIFDKEGKIVCEIENNEWTINKNNYFKRNYDDNAIEVIDQYDNVVLSAEMKFKNTIHVNGIFNVVGKTFLFAYDDVLSTLEYFPEAVKIIEQMENKPWDELYRERAKRIPRMFSYGNDSFGKRLK